MTAHNPSLAAAANPASSLSTDTGAAKSGIPFIAPHRLANILGGHAVEHRPEDPASISLALTGLLGFGTLAVGVWMWSGM